MTHIQKILSSLQKIYQIPMKGTVEQYSGSMEDKGNIITTIYRLEADRLIISSKLETLMIRWSKVHTITLLIVISKRITNKMH